jgi:hypothetical protein
MAKASVAEWGEPVLVEHELRAGPKGRRVLARIGYPRRITNDDWTCSYQLLGTTDKRWRVEDGKVSRAMSDDGLHALWNACSPVRGQLDRVKDVHPCVPPHEFVFPEFLPTYDTRHGLDFYRELTHILWAEIKESGVSQPEAPPPTETLAQSTWTEPALIDRKFEFGSQKHGIRVRIGFPYFLSGENTWACSFQLEGLGEGLVQRVRGENGLWAAARATRVIRESFDALEAPSFGVHYEFMFPAYLPIQHGLELHRRLRKVLDAERARRLRNQLRSWRRREQRSAARERAAKAS